MSTVKLATELDPYLLDNVARVLLWNHSGSDFSVKLLSCDGRSFWVNASHEPTSDHVIPRELMTNNY